MSVQFGRWNFGGEPPTPGYLEKAGQLLARYGPDGGGSYSGPGVDIIYRAFHTTKESRRQSQPLRLTSGAVITWDGRLDNREELHGQLGRAVTHKSTDVAIAAAAYERWGIKVFAQLLGDWAVSIWDPQNRELILARDFLGTRHLYYTSEKQQVTWSTILDPLVLLAGRTFPLEEEYLAGWLSHFPATHLTPYAGIHAVPPSCFVCLHPGKETVTKYWDFDPRKRIRYATDRGYEEHFRAVFRESVRRRLRSDSPILAELSGGMDSSSIVCMADRIIAGGEAKTPRLDTVSYYDDSEPNWNERPYFSKVEEQRGRAGCHIDAESRTILNYDFDYREASLTPASCVPGGDSSGQFAECIISNENRVVLSGIGGDEFTGGVPTPIPELADLLARAQFGALAHQLRLWALNKRKPWLYLLLETARGFLSPFLVGVAEYARPAPWLRRDFVRRNRDAAMGYPSRLKFFGCPPSFQENISTLDNLRRQVASTAPSFSPPYEKLYPFLDRGFLDFIFAVPREQLLRPGQRRSLMRRALDGLVPEAVLNRRRKAYVVHTPLETIFRELPKLLKSSGGMVSVSLGILDKQRFSKALDKAKNTQEIPIAALMRMLAVERWLKYSPHLRLLDFDQSLGHLAQVRSTGGSGESVEKTELASS